MIKKKILWVVYDFVQAGGQRYVYEICKALNKKKYEIDILKVSSLGLDKNWTSEYYYQPTLDMGCRIFILPDLLSPKAVNKNRSVKEMIRPLREKLKFASTNSDKTEASTEALLLNTLFSNYDCINFSGVSVYQVSCIENGLHPDKAIIHILSFSFQDQLMYNAFDKNLYYNFVSPVTPGAIENDLKDFKHYTYSYFPLCFETIPYEVDTEINKEIFTIAIFTRLSDRKPLDPFFYALKILIEMGVNIKLEIFGAGDPEALGIGNQMRYLYIQPYVHFRGHCNDIPDTLQNNPPDLLWFQSANKEPGGYAALEIAMSGIPQVFWDFMDLGINRPIEKIFPSFTKMLDFVQFSKKLLEDSEHRKILGERQRNYVLKEYSIKDHIHILETIYDT